MAQEGGEGGIFFLLLRMDKKAETHIDDWLLGSIMQTAANQYAFGAVSRLEAVCQWNVRRGVHG